MSFKYHFCVILKIYVMIIVKTKFGLTAAYAYDFGTPNGQAAVTRSGNEIFLKFKF